MPAFYDDVNNDGKLEYLWNYNKDKMQSLSIDGSLVLDLNAIKDAAINRLGMKSATQDQIVYYSVDNNNYMDQYNDIPE